MTTTVTLGSQQVDIVNIDSSFRTSGQPYNFTLNLFNRIRNISKIEIVSTDLPEITLNGINHSNSTLILARNQLSLVYINIPTGAYTDSTLAAEIQSQLNTRNIWGSIWTCTFSTNKYTISNATQAFYISSSGLINTTLGFINPTTTPQLSITSDGITQLNKSNYVLVVSKSLNPHQGVPSVIEHARIVHTVTSTNNIVVLNDSVSDYKISIPDGQYNLYEIAEVLNTEFQSQAANSVAQPIYVEYRRNIETNQNDFQIRGNATITLSGTFVKSILNYYISSNTVGTTLRIYSAPLNSSSVLIIDPVLDVANTGGIVVSQAQFKYRAAAKSSTGKLYFAPFDASNILVINTFNNTNQTLAIPTGVDGFDTDNRWSDAILAPNGKIYFVPYHDRWWATVDPSTDTVDRNACAAFTGAYHSKEITLIETVSTTAGNLNGKYFTIYNTTTTYYIWYNVDGNGTDLTPGGGDVVNISANDSAIEVARATWVVINGLSGFTASVSGNKVSVTVNAYGPVTNAVDNDTTFTITTMNPGSFIQESLSANPIADVGGSLNNKYFTLYSTTVGYYIWFNVNGAGADPLVGGMTGIAVPIATSASVVNIISAIASAMVGYPFTITTTSTSIVFKNDVAGITTPGVDVNTGFTIQMITGSGGSGVRFYSKGVLVGDEIWPVPWQIGNGIGVLNTTYNSVRNVTSGVLSNPSNYPLFSSGVYVPQHNKIYCCPFFTKNTILVINLATEQMSELTDVLIPAFSGGTAFDPGYERWSDIVLAPNGKMYCIPFSEDFILVLDTATDPPTFSSPVGLQGLGTVSSTYTLANLSIDVNFPNQFTNARKWASGILTPDQKIWCMPLLDNRILIIDTLTDTYTFSQSNIPIGVDKWFGSVLSDSYTIYEDSLRKATAGHIVHKTYLNDATNGRIVTTAVQSPTIVSYPSGYNLSSVDISMTDNFGNYITELSGDFSMLLRITHS